MNESDSSPARHPAEALHTRFESLRVQSHLLLLLLAMLGALSWIASSKSDSAAHPEWPSRQSTLPTPLPQADTPVQLTFAALAGCAGSCALAFQKVRSTEQQRWQSSSFARQLLMRMSCVVASLLLQCVAELALDSDDDILHRHTLGVVALLLLAWTLMVAFEVWWRRCALRPDDSSDTPDTSHPSVLKTYIVSSVLVRDVSLALVGDCAHSNVTLACSCSGVEQLGVLQGAVVFDELRLESPAQAPLVCSGVAGTSSRSATCSQRHRADADQRCSRRAWPSNASVPKGIASPSGCDCRRVVATACSD